MDSYAQLQLKENADIYRNALERIVEKYSRVDGSGMEVCLQSMTYRSDTGVLPWCSVDEVQLKRAVDSRLLSYTEAENTGVLQDEIAQLHDIGSISRESSEGTSGTWMSGLNQPEDVDGDLEQTLSSNGSTLLDLYPSMLSQVGEAWRRQQVTQAASAVLRRYKRQGWFSHGHKSGLLDASSHNERITFDIRSFSNDSLQSREWREKLALIHEASTDATVIDESRCFISPPRSDTFTANNCQIIRQRLPLNQATPTLSITPRPHKRATPTPPISPRSHEQAMPTLLISPRPPKQAMPTLPNSPRPQKRATPTFLISPRPQKQAMPTLPISLRPQKRATPTLLISPRLQMQAIPTFQISPRSQKKAPSSLLISPITQKRTTPTDWMSSPGCLPPAASWLPSSSVQSSWVRRILPQRRNCVCVFESRPDAEKQLELEFQKLYHRFVCQSRPAMTHSSSLEALALSPLRCRLWKRHRELDNSISPKSKRFREEPGVLLTCSSFDRPVDHHPNFYGLSSSCRPKTLITGSQGNPHAAPGKQGHSAGLCTITQAPLRRRLQYLL